MTVKKLLWITENYPPNKGGMAESCNRIVASLRKLGYVIHVFHFSNRKKPFFTEQKINGSYTAIPKHHDIAHTLNLGLNFLSNPATKLDYEAIVAFGGLLPMNGAPVYARLMNKQLYTFIRGNDFDISVFSPKRKYYLDQAFACSKEVCANSHDKAKRIQLLYPDTKVHYIPNGIDSYDWLPLKSEIENMHLWRKNNTKPNTVTIGLFGVLKEKKGIRFFLESLLKSGLKEQVHLILTGNIDDDKVVQLIEKHQIQTTLLPFMDRNELLKYYTACDWIAIPSFYEGMPNVLMEAGILGIPIIASNVDGMKDLLINNENGLTFHPADKEACAQQIFKAVKMNENERLRLGNMLKDEITIHYTADQEAMLYDCFFSGNHDRTLLSRIRSQHELQTI
ncbi:MAG: glycosyltransferase family 4 protein [Carboxylicivirga sp.]|jgi:glycosyltransferase involved in cell wall biosynthesis|nr:glycosyltransferase family 4 protein [Carboxylicivirga sp.]